MDEARHYIIRGLVQGVYFRKYTEAKAQSLKLHGWVRNLSDGSVEAFAQGSAESLKALQMWFWEGSPGSQVGEVRMSPASLEELKEFSIRESA